MGVGRVAGVRNTALLLVIAGAGLANGLGLYGAVPLWRAGLCVVLVVAAFLHGRCLPVPRVWPVAAAGLAAVLGVAVWKWYETTTVVAMATMFVVLPWLAGRYLRQRAELIAVGQARIADLERERAYVADGARLRERARIAADLHDALGHELALVALRAGALELGTGVPAAQREAAADLRRAAVGATDRLRETLGMLRDASPGRPWDESIEDLAARVRAAGMTVTVSRTGSGGALPPLVDRAAHRVTQEALTNAARHAPGAPVTIRLDHTAGACTLTVTNPLPPGAGTGTGSGLEGLRERVRLLDGTLDAGPADGEFAVRAWIPVEAGR